MTNDELREWIDQEGGMDGLLRHGLNGEWPDDEVTAQLLTETVSLHAQFDNARSTLQRHIGY